MSATARTRITPEVLAAAHARGFAKIATTRVARAAGCAETTVRTWSAGDDVSAETDRAIRAAIGLPADGTPTNP